MPKKQSLKFSILLAGCSGVGDNGRFVTEYVDDHVSIMQNAIRCGADKDQCPAGWECVDSLGAPVVDANAIGVCHDPLESDAGLECPSAPSTPWAQDADDDLALTVACMGNQSTGGCVFEQPLSAAATGLMRDDQGGFIRDNKLLVVMVVSDEDDCSMEDGPGLFADEDMKDLAQTGDLACGEARNQKFLYNSRHFMDTFKEVKHGEAGSVMFIAIVGVPGGEDSPCEGSGTELDGCLDHPQMQRVKREVKENGEATASWSYACERDEVTHAAPGRRFVELAQEYERMGHVYSICNKDWSRIPAVADISRLINSMCYDKQLDYDREDRRTPCDIRVGFNDIKECPAEFGDAAPKTRQVSHGDTIQTEIYCKLPQLRAQKNCGDILNIGALNEKFGWYYCENIGYENYGDVCKYNLAFTPSARHKIKGHSIELQCPVSFYNEDSNCQ